MMLSLLRNIRRSLLNSGSTRRYILYALGEFILIVAGILVAMEINNWNEERKLDKERLSYIKALHDELILDTLSIKNSIEIVSSERQEIRMIQNRLLGPQATIDTVKYIAQIVYRPGIYLGGTFNSTTYSVLESTGKIELFDDHIKQSIIKLNRLQNRTLEVIKNDVENYSKFITDYQSKYSFRSERAESYFSRLSWEIEDEKEFFALFLGLVDYHSYSYRKHLTMYEDILQNTRLLLIDLKTVVVDKTNQAVK